MRGRMPKRQGSSHSAPSGRISACLGVTLRVDLAGFVSWQSLSSAGASCPGGCLPQNADFVLDALAQGIDEHHPRQRGANINGFYERSAQAPRGRPTKTSNLQLTEWIGAIIAAADPHRRPSRCRGQLLSPTRRVRNNRLTHRSAPRCLCGSQPLHPHPGSLMSHRDTTFGFPQYCAAKRVMAAAYWRVVLQLTLGLIVTYVNNSENTQAHSPRRSSVTRITLEIVASAVFKTEARCTDGCGV
jgi:hypothetical protein